jgi:hypothetical protein
MGGGRNAIFYVLVGLSILSAVQWIRAQFVHEWFRSLSPRPGPVIAGSIAPTPAYARVIELNGSGVAYRFFDCNLRLSEPMGLSYQRARPGEVIWSEATLSWRTLWLSRSKDRQGNGQMALPYWAICMSGIAAIGIRSLVRRRRAWRENLQLCPDCGYDLRATPSRCPECGREITAPQVASSLQSTTP